MKLTFLGADREVTGSCTQLEAAGHRFLIDCGMEQGRDVYENADLPCAPGTYEALLLTHAHIDHSGRIPYLYKNGYRGPIYTTDATRDLCAIMLEDSAHIQEQEAEWKNRKAMRSGAEMIEPDYTVEDAQNVMKQFVLCPYETWQTLFDGPTGKIEMRFTDVGHLLGSASVSLRIAEPGRTAIDEVDWPSFPGPTPSRVHSGHAVIGMSRKHHFMAASRHMAGRNHGVAA